MKRLLTFFLVLTISGCITIPISPRLEPFEEHVLKKGGKDKVLVIDISGILFDGESHNVFGSRTKINLTARITEELDKARQDPNIKAVIVKVDSPGGAVTTSDVIHHELLQYKEEKDVYMLTHMGSLAASGGYYVAVASDHIMAMPTTVTGSIGVIATMLNIQGLMEKIGVEDQTVASGKSKQMGSIFKKMSKEERALFQEIIDSMYERFLSVVLNGRPKLSRSDLLKVADGRIVTANRALKSGLIDSIGYWSDALHQVNQEAELSDPTVICYVRPGSYKPNAYTKVSLKSESNISIINLNTDLFYSKFKINFMYLMMP